MVSSITEKMVNPRALIKGNAHQRHIQTANYYAQQHFSADNRRTAALRLLFQILLQCRLTAKGQSRQRIHNQIYPQNLRNSQRLVDVDKRRDKVNRHRRSVNRQLKDDKFADRIINRATIKNGLLDAEEIIVKNNDVACLLRHLSATAHGKADVRLFQGRGIIDAVARHAHDKVQLLRQTHKAQLIQRQRTRNNAQARQQQLDIIITQLCQLVRCPDNLIRMLQKACVLSNRHCCFLAVAGNHNHLHACLLHRRNRFHSLRAHIVTNRHNAHHRQAALRQLAVNRALIAAQRQHTHSLTCQLQHSCVQLLLHAGCKRQSATFCVPIKVGTQQKLLRRTLDQAIRIVSRNDLSPGIFAGAVERHKVLTLRHLLHTVAAKISAQCRLRHIAADNFALADSGRGIEHHLLIGQLLDFLRQHLKARQLLLIAGDKAHNLQLALGNRACFVRK